MSYSCLVIAPAHDACCPADFRHYGIRVQLANSSAAARSLIGGWRFDAIVWFVDALGDSACRDIRRLSAHSAAPLLVVTRPTDDAALIRALDSGATSWLVSPVLPQVVAAKARSLIDSAQRLAWQDPQPVLRIGSLTLDHRKAMAQAHGAALPLSTAQFDLLSMLAARVGGCVRREEIAARCLRVPRPGRGVDMLICRLRRRLRDAGADDVELVARYSSGYGLVQVAAHDATELRDPRPERLALTLH